MPLPAHTTFTENLAPAAIARAAFRWLAACALAIAQQACVYLPGPGHGTIETMEANAALSGFQVALAEPGPHEVVLIINLNAPAGNHSGLFAGQVWFDPAGSYQRVRRTDPDWRPGLADYVRYQMLDGPQVRSYRFSLNDRDFAEVRRRIAHAGVAWPLNCAFDVKRLVAGIGPFASWRAEHWLSPASLAKELDALPEGLCQMPGGRACRKSDGD